MNIKVDLASVMADTASIREDIKATQTKARMLVPRIEKLAVEIVRTNADKTGNLVDLLKKLRDSMVALADGTPF